MEFSFNINDILRDEITCLDSSCTSLKSNNSFKNDRELQNKLYEVIDKMGEASAKAQGLHGAITTGNKLKVSDHRLYVMKDISGNSGKGSAVGILKVGRKKLFIYDSAKMQHEIQPLCVLDFYIHESRQRTGCGRKLFGFMLAREMVPVQHLALDRPSPKFLSFMARHYNLKAIIPQVYNFVVYESFFDNRSDMRNSQGKQWENSYHPKQNTFLGPKRPTSGFRNSPASGLDQNTFGSLTRQNQVDQQSGHMGAGVLMYSRHSSFPAGPTLRPSSNYGRSLYTPVSNCYNASHNNSVGPAFRSSSGNKPHHSSLYNNQFAAREAMNRVSPPHSHQNIDSRHMVYSNHQQESQNARHSEAHMAYGPVFSTSQQPEWSPVVAPASNAAVAGAVTHQSAVPSLGSLQSGGWSSTQDINADPPLLRRDGPASPGSAVVGGAGQQRNLNSASGPAGAATKVFHNSNSPQLDHEKVNHDGQPTLPFNRPATNNNSWTVMGVLREQQFNNLVQHGRTSNHRLW